MGNILPILIIGRSEISVGTVEKALRKSYSRDAYLRSESECRRYVEWQSVQLQNPYGGWEITRDQHYTTAGGLNWGGAEKALLVGNCNPPLTMQSVRIEIIGMESGTHLENCFSWAGDIRPHAGRNYAVLRVSVAEIGHCRNEIFAAAKSCKSLICECRSTALLPQGKRRRPISVMMRRMAMRSDMADPR
jgi:hypothetical protein